MTAAEAPVNEGELHAYLDGELNPARVAAVEAHFLKNDADAMRFGAYRRQSDLMRRVYGRIDAQPITDDLLPQGPGETPPQAVSSSRAPWALAVLLALALGAAAGWFGRIGYEQHFAQDVASSIRDEALAAHRISLADRPAEVEVMGGAGRPALEWLAREFGFSAESPTLQEQGFEIVAGRLVPSPAGIGAHLLLRDVSGERLSLYVRPGGSQRLSGFELPAGSPAPMVVWQAAGTSLALVADLPADRLRRIAGAIQSGLVAPATALDEDT